MGVGREVRRERGNEWEWEGGEVGVGREERSERYCMVFVYSYWGTGTVSPHCGCFDKGLV